MSERNQSEPDIKLSAIGLGVPHPCVEPGGWPEIEITLSYYVRNTEDLEVVRAQGRREMERLIDTLLPDEAENA